MGDMKEELFAEDDGGSLEPLLGKLEGRSS